MKVLLNYLRKDKSKNISNYRGGKIDGYFKYV